MSTADPSPSRSSHAGEAPGTKPPERWLACRDLMKSYGRRRVVDRVSIQVRTGEVVGLLGPNGAGKTTTFRMIVGLVPAEAGSVTLDQDDLTGLPLHRRARRGIGYLPQEPSVFRGLTVEENLLAILELRGMRRAERLRRTRNLLEEFGLTARARAFGESLSGGERRRAEIARALATDPAFLLLDEPFAACDPIAVAELQRVLAQLRDRNLGVLVTDHSVRETLRVTDRAYIIEEGRILFEGNPDELVASPDVRRAYLGHDWE